MAEMKQFMVMMPELDVMRMDALRVVMGISRAEIGRRLIASALPALEFEHSARLDRLKLVASHSRYPGWQEFVRYLLDNPGNRQRVPALEDLEDKYLQRPKRY
jgi:hypothetical protein